MYTHIYKYTYIRIRDVMGSGRPRPVCYLEMPRDGTGQPGWDGTGNF